MNNNDKKKFAEIMVTTGELFGKEITQTLMKTYFQMLIIYPIEKVEQAFHSHLLDPDQGMFFPKPANIAKQLAGTSKQQEQEVDDTAEIQWHTIIGEMSRIGSYGTLKLEDGQALAAIKAVGGWRHICSLTTDQLVWVKKEFVAAYKNYERTPVELLPHNLPGRFEIENKKSKDKSGMKSLADGLKKFNETRGK